MNHKSLLKKYIQHVFSCEGSDFISSARTDAGMNDVVFTQEELKELANIQNEIDNDSNSFVIERNNLEISYFYTDSDEKKHKIEPPIDFLKSKNNIDLSKR